MLEQLDASPVLVSANDSMEKKQLDYEPRVEKGSKPVRILPLILSPIALVLMVLMWRFIHWYFYVWDGPGD